MLRSVQLLAKGMRYGRAAGTVRLGRPETSIVPPPLAAPLFLPPSQAFFHFFFSSTSPGFLSLPPSFLLLAFFMSYHLRRLIPVLMSKADSKAH